MRARPPVIEAVRPIDEILPVARRYAPVNEAFDALQEGYVGLAASLANAKNAGPTHPSHAGVDRARNACGNLETALKKALDDVPVLMPGERANVYIKMKADAVQAAIGSVSEGLQNYVAGELSQTRTRRP